MQFLIQLALSKGTWVSDIISQITLWNKFLEVALLDGLRAGSIALYKSGLVSEELRHHIDTLERLANASQFLSRVLGFVTSGLSLGLNGLASAARDNVVK
jgi:hypothetical protein